MKKIRTDDDVDCLALKRRAQDQILERTHGMSPEEEIEYLRRTVETGSLATLWNSLQADSPPRERNGSTAHPTRSE